MACYLPIILVILLAHMNTSSGNSLINQTVYEQARKWNETIFVDDDEQRSYFEADREYNGTDYAVKQHFGLEWLNFAGLTFFIMVLFCIFLHTSYILNGFIELWKSNDACRPVCCNQAVSI